MEAVVEETNEKKLTCSHYVFGGAISSYWLSVGHYGINPGSKSIIKLNCVMTFLSLCSTLIPGRPKCFLFCFVFLSFFLSVFSFFLSFFTCFCCMMYKNC